MRRIPLDRYEFVCWRCGAQGTFRVARLTSTSAADHRAVEKAIVRHELEAKRRGCFEDREIRVKILERR